MDGVFPKISKTFKFGKKYWVTAGDSTSDNFKIEQFLRPQRPARNNCFEQHNFGSLSLSFQTAQLNSLQP